MLAKVGVFMGRRDAVGCTSNS